MLYARFRALEARMIHRRLLTCVVVVGLLISVPAVHAGTQAKIEGRVTDVTGKPIAGAVVTITTSEMSSYKKTLATDEDGEFQALILDATRRYDFLVEAEGYRPETSEFKVGVGSTNNFFEFALQTAQQAAAAEDRKLLEQPGYKELREGKELLQAGDNEGARLKFEEAVAAKPDLLEALGRLAEMTYEAGDMERSLDLARRCLDGAPESLPCLAIAVNASGALGDETARSEYLARYHELNPDDPTLLFNQAAVLLNDLDDEGARPVLERCLAADPDFPECNFEYGMLLLRLGDMEGAKKHLQKYLEIAPDGPLATTAQETIKYL
jgi:tetratricopeptide (TPR) repeat protein